MTSLKSSLPKQLHTPRLILDLWNDSDEHLDALLECFNNPIAVSRTGDFGLRTRDDARGLCNAVGLKNDDLVPGKKADTFIAYMPRLKNSPNGSLSGGPNGGPHGSDADASEIIGCMSLVHRGQDVPPDIGWAILPPYMGNGYATEAATELYKFLTKELGMSYFTAVIRQDNLPSIHVAEKIGMVRGPDAVLNTVAGKDEVPNVAYVIPGMKVESFELNFGGEEKKQG